MLLFILSDTNNLIIKVYMFSISRRFRKRFKGAFNLERLFRLEKLFVIKLQHRSLRDI